MKVLLASPSRWRLSAVLLAAAGVSALVVAAGAWARDPATRGSVLDRLTRRDRLYDVTFVGPHAWVVGFPGLILHSRDGGQTWESQDGGAKEALFAVDFVDARRGWVVGRGGLILHTANGGRRWTTQPSQTKQQLFAVDFLPDGREGWAVGSFGATCRTTDGGKTWTPVKVALQVDPASQAASQPARPRTRAVTKKPAKKKAAGDAEEDFGDGAWGGDDNPYGVEVKDDTTAQGPTEEATPIVTAQSFDRHLNGVWVLSPGVVVAAGESGKIVMTADGGKTWQERPSNEWAPLYDVLFTSEKDGFVSGGVGTVLHTIDGGKSWKRLKTGSQEHLFGLVMGGGRLHAVGRRGTLLRAAPDGSRFETVPLGLYGWISAVAFGDGGAGLLVGGQGLIMRTTDGGQSWRQAGRE